MILSSDDAEIRAGREFLTAEEVYQRQAHAGIPLYPRPPVRIVTA
jgi:hypothetical protein